MVAAVRPPGYQKVRERSHSARWIVIDPKVQVTGSAESFLTAFACRNQSFYAAVREARLRLEDWEKRFPGAKWLPVIYQNPTVIPPTWKQLRTRGSIKAVERSVNSPFTRQHGLSLWKFLIGLIGLGTVTVVFIVAFQFYTQNYPQPETGSKSSPSSKPTKSTLLNLPSVKDIFVLGPIIVSSCLLIVFRLKVITTLL